MRLIVKDLVLSIVGIAIAGCSQASSPTILRIGITSKNRSPIIESLNNYARENPTISLDLIVEGDFSKAQREFKRQSLDVMMIYDDWMGEYSGILRDLPDVSKLQNRFVDGLTKKNALPIDGNVQMVLYNETRSKDCNVQGGRLTLEKCSTKCLEHFTLSADDGGVGRFISGSLPRIRRSRKDSRRGVSLERGCCIGSLTASIET